MRKFSNIFSFNAVEYAAQLIAGTRTINVYDNLIYQSALKKITSEADSSFKINIDSFGTTANRPTSVDIGYGYFDTTISKMIHWDGTKWVEPLVVIGSTATANNQNLISMLVNPNYNVGSFTDSQKIDLALTNKLGLMGGLVRIYGRSVGAGQGIVFETSSAIAYFNEDGTFQVSKILLGDFNSTGLSTLSNLTVQGSTFKITSALTRIEFAKGGSNTTYVGNNGSNDFQIGDGGVRGFKQFFATKNHQLGVFVADIPCSILTINSTTQGVLLPRMTTAQINAIVSPVEGLEVFNLSTHKKCFYDGTSWQQITSTAM